MKDWRPWGLITELQEMEWKKDPFYYDKEIPFNDFNKEIMRPKQHPDFPQGGVILRADDDFWQIGFLPYRFHEVNIADIVQTLWPDKWEKAVFGDDVDFEDDELDSEADAVTSDETTS